MKQTQIFIRKLFFLICILIHFRQFLSESISICQYNNTDIKCQPDHYIVITNATLGHLPHLDMLNRNGSKWCQKPDSFFKKQPMDCVVSLRKLISNQCTGTNNCYLGVVPAYYWTEAAVVCNENSYPLSLYINYDCVSKELFISPDDMAGIFHIGGYMTSLGYSEQKSGEREVFNDLATIYRKKGLPIRKLLKPKWNHGLRTFIFQLQIIENSISLNSTTSSLICQTGELFAQDYYAFIPTNETQNNNVSRELTICPAKADMIGQIFGPIITTGVNITVNVNFNSFPKRVLLVKFTMIVCPNIIIDNAYITYDHVVSTGKQLSVTGIAIINCKPGFFLSSQSTSMSNITSKTITCDHESGLWHRSQVLEKCIDKLPISILSTSMRLNTTLSSVTKPPNQTSEPSSQMPTSTMLINSRRPSTKAAIFVKYILPVLVIFVIVLALLIIFFWRFKKEIKCIDPFRNWYSKLCSKNDNIQLRCPNYPRPAVRSSFGHTIISDDNFPMLDSFIVNTMSPNGSCRQSNRTLTTRAGSRPTIISGDSMQTSNDNFDNYHNQMFYNDELPTKSPKTSTLTRIMRSAGNLRNSSFGRPKSLSRQSFTDRGSSIFDSRFSGSQIPLLMSRRSNLPPEFLGSNSVMCTSDISPSKTLTKSAVLLRKNHNSRPYSQSDLFLKSQMNDKVISPTIDTYLEPTESSIVPYAIPGDGNASWNGKHKNSDYMIYDHSRISSNNPDTTCQSSVIASLSDDNANDDEDRKRFSMISNHYYGMQGAEPRSNNPPFVSPLASIQNGNNTDSNESIYESIDGDHLRQSTIDRRHIALPPPPPED